MLDSVTYTVDSMKIAIVNTVRPYQRSGAGVTEYTYQLGKSLSASNKVTYIYTLGRVQSNDVRGLLVSFLLLVPRIWGVARKDFDVVHITNHEIGSAALLLKLFGSKAKIVTTVHDLIRMRKNLHAGLIQKAFNGIVGLNIGSALKHSDLVLFDSAQTRDEVRRKFGRVRRYKVVTLGVKDELLRRKIVKKSHKGFVVGYLGAFARHKNPAAILHVASILKQGDGYRFMLYGTGVMEGELMAYKSENGLDNVHFMGMASRTDIVKIYDSFDAFMFPSLYEGFGFPILEAQARGLPVVVFGKSAISDEITKCCLKARDEGHCARILAGLSTNGYDAHLRARAMSYARSFTWSRTARETLEAYNALPGVKSGGS